MDFMVNNYYKKGTTQSMFGETSGIIMFTRVVNFRKISLEVFAAKYDIIIPRKSMRAVAAAKNNCGKYRHAQTRKRLIYRYNRSRTSWLMLIIIGIPRYDKTRSENK